MSEVMVSLEGGVTLGGTYALIGLALVLVFRATATLNFAQGGLMLLPAYFVAVWTTRDGDSFVLAMVLALVLTATVCAVFYTISLRPLAGRPPVVALMATFGLSGILDALLAVLLGSNIYTVKASFLSTRAVDILGARTTLGTLFIMAFTLALALLTLGVVRFTRIGLKLRAAGQDPLLASQGGINAQRYHLGSWAVAGILAAVAGVAYGATNEVGTDMTTVAVSALPAILLGGLDSIEGAVVGGVLIGVLQGFVTTYLGGQAINFVTYLILLAVLLVRPQGLFGTRQVVRV